MSLRDIILWFMPPAMKADAEADSRKWVATCPRCQTESSVWEMGGIRYKAYGTKTSLVRCPKCGKNSFMRIHKKS
jgi:ribosomal protein S27AE